MNLKITCTHKLGFQYQLVTRTSDVHNYDEFSAIGCAIKYATHQFGLLPAPFNFTIEVLRETN